MTVWRCSTLRAPFLLLPLRTGRAEKNPNFPQGQACTCFAGPQGFWASMCCSVDLPGAAPLQRWDTDALFDPMLGSSSRIYTRFGSYLDRVEDFDVAAFKLSQAEALHMDPHARLLLEHTQVCLHGVMCQVCLREAATLCGPASYKHDRTELPMTYTGAASTTADL